MFRSAGAYFSNSGSPIYAGAGSFNKDRSMFRSNAIVGPRMAYQDGSLGMGPVVGPRMSYQDGSLGVGPVGPMRAFRSGSLGGCSSCSGTGEYFAANGTGEYFATNGWWQDLSEDDKKKYMIGGAVAAAALVLFFAMRKKR